ncbi:MAG TPA: outer membrane lipid asymmetry maintenance protein MlaD [Geminicoccaceae bacterium]|nr:outer membrane lipid asymmetry maintenance protein MlaD [Geminicoccaceae bacterium]
MSRSAVETILGGLVLVVAIGFFVWAYGRANVGATGGYLLSAQFDRVDGLTVGGEVRISGIPVGRVVSQRLDPETYRARVTFTVQDGVALPADSSAAIASSSLLGGRYLAVVPGGDDQMLRPGEEITITQSAINIEDLIGRYIFSQGPAAGGAAPPTGAGAAGGSAPSDGLGLGLGLGNGGGGGGAGGGAPGAEAPADAPQ